MHHKKKSLMFLFQFIENRAMKETSHFGIDIQNKLPFSKSIALFSCILVHIFLQSRCNSPLYGLTLFAIFQCRQNIFYSLFHCIFAFLLHIKYRGTKGGQLKDEVIISLTEKCSLVRNLNCFKWKYKIYIYEYHIHVNVYSHTCLWDHLF